MLPFMVHCKTWNPFSYSISNDGDQFSLVCDYRGVVWEEDSSSGGWDSHFGQNRGPAQLPGAPCVWGELEHVLQILDVVAQVLV